MSSRKPRDVDDDDYDSGRDEKKKKRRHSRSRSRGRGDSDGDRRKRRSRSRSRSRSPKRLKKKKSSAWDNTVGDSTSALSMFGGSTLMPAGAGVAPVAHMSHVQAPMPATQVGAAAFLTSAAQAALARIYVGNIFFEISEDDIKTVFERCGTIRSVQMTREPANGNKHKGFCFIEFASCESAETAIATMNGYQLAGRSLRVGRPHNPAASLTGNIQASAPALQPILLPQKDDVAIEHNLPQIKGCKMCVPGEQKTPSGYPLKGEPKVYAANIPTETSQETINLEFSAHGRVKSLKVEADVANPNRQFALIEYDDDGAAEKAVRKMHNHKMDGHRLKVGRVVPAAAAQNTLIYQQVQQVASLRQAGLPVPSNFGLAASMGQGDMAQPPPLDSVTHEETMNISTGSARVALMQKLMRRDEAESMKQPLGAAQPKPGQPLVQAPGQPVPQALAQQQPIAKPMAPAPTSSGEVNTPTRCIVLTNLVGSPQEVDDDLGVEVKEECSRYGQVEHLLIFDDVNQATQKVDVKFFILYSNLGGAMKAVEKLNGRYFAKRKISCKFYHEALFKKLLTE